MHVRRKRRRDGSMSPYWTIEVLDRDGRKRSRRGPVSKEEAKRLGHEWQSTEDAIRKGLRPRPKKSEELVAIVEVYQQYLAWGATHGGRRGRPWAEETRRKKTERLDWWWEWLGISHVSDFVGSLAAVEAGIQELTERGEARRTVWNFA